jgi:hypothetical protein
MRVEVDDDHGACKARCEVDNARGGGPRLHFEETPRPMEDSRRSLRSGVHQPTTSAGG